MKQKGMALVMCAVMFLFLPLFGILIERLFSFTTGEIVATAIPIVILEIIIVILFIAIIGDEIKLEEYFKES